MPPSPHNQMTLWGRRALLFGALIGVLGCATLEPMVAAPEDERQDTSPDPSPVKSAPLRVVPEEARPNGLLLRLSMEDLGEEATPDGARLELWRAIDDQPAAVVQQVALKPRTARALRGAGVAILDGDARAETQLAYQLRLITGEDELQSPVTRLRWDAPPPAPTTLEAVALSEDAVQLAWDAPKEWGALIFRRDLQRAPDTLGRVAQVRAHAQGIYVDRSARPGGLYAYRVSLARLVRTQEGDHEFSVFGAPSVEVYVATPSGASP